MPIRLEVTYSFWLMLSERHSSVDSDWSLKLAVVSDIHAWDDTEGSAVGSWLTLTQAEFPSAHHPIAALLNRVSEEKLKADYLLCAGDMGDKANQKAIKYAWEQVIRLGEALSVKRVIATPGNHDVDSRKTRELDAKGFLQRLRPTFPFGEDVLNDRLWSRNFAILDEDEVRFVVLNTSAYHGTVPKDGCPPEYEHGRISQLTLQSIEEELGALSSTPYISILLCHHHPHKHLDIEDEDYSTMEDGSKLIDLLGSGRFGRWLIIHGHKHHPRICYGGGPSSAPIIFGAGSLCAKLPPELHAFARNQFYFLEVPIGRARQLGLDLAGSFRAWDWIPRVGWRTAGPSSGLPASGGFGFRIEMTVELERLAAWIKVRDEPYVKWSEILDYDPRFEFLLPIDTKIIADKLETKHGLKVVQNDLGGIEEIAR